MVYLLHVICVKKRKKENVGQTQNQLVTCMIFGMRLIPNQFNLLEGNYEINPIEQPQYLFPKLKLTLNEKLFGIW